ncbi:uncharacterized protein [Miscanthus floridulus]|uniref:uncharacterized protein n=1 Tax=Miscanthus floridulus TaxID=154761 RepID=UPI0034597A37
MEGLVKCGLLRWRTDAAEWLMPGHEEVPAPPDDYVVSFTPFHEHRLTIPPHPFFWGLLHHYQIELQHLNPNGIQHIMAFIALCEGYLGIEPHFELWRYFFSISLQKNKKRDSPDRGLRVVGVIGAYHTRRVALLMARVLPLYGMTPDAQLDRTALAQGPLHDNEVTQRIKETMDESDAVFSIQGHPAIWPDAGFVELPDVTLLYFRGAIYMKEGGSIRQELYYMLKDEKDVYFSFGSVQDHGASKASQGMHSSKFCLNIARDTPSSNRLFDAIVSHCVPVIISDNIELPYEDVLDYSKFSIFVRSSDAVKKGYLMRLLSGVSKQQWTKMWNRLKEVDKHFEYQYPSQKDDAVQMIWQALSRKVPTIKLKVHRSSRFSRSDRGK